MIEDLGHRQLPLEVGEVDDRYTHRVAISSNQRLVNVADGQVTFRYKDYADDHRPKTMTLAADTPDRILNVVSPCIARARSMISRTLCLSLVLLALVGEAIGSDQNKQDVEKLQGKRKVVTSEFEGRPATAD